MTTTEQVICAVTPLHAPGSQEGLGLLQEETVPKCWGLSPSQDDD